MDAPLQSIALKFKWTRPDAMPTDAVMIALTHHLNNLAHDTLKLINSWEADCQPEVVVVAEFSKKSDGSVYANTKRIYQANSDSDSNEPATTHRRNVICGNDNEEEEGETQEIEDKKWKRENTRRVIGMHHKRSRSK